MLLHILAEANWERLSLYGKWVQISVESDFLRNLGHKMWFSSTLYLLLLKRELLTDSLLDFCNLTHFQFTLHTYKLTLHFEFSSSSPFKHIFKVWFHCSAFVFKTSSKLLCVWFKSKSLLVSVHYGISCFSIIFNPFFLFTVAKEVFKNPNEVQLIWVDSSEQDSKTAFTRIFSLFC